MCCCDFVYFIVFFNNICWCDYLSSECVVYNIIGGKCDIM